MATWPENSSSAVVCGDFAVPVNPNLGGCNSLRVKTDCEAPTLPVAQCADDTYTTVYDPDATPKFSVVAKLFDEGCNPVLDENNVQITTIVQ